jgi:hypothetical protein
MSGIQATFYIEAQGTQGQAVEDALRSMVEGLRREEGVEVKKESFEEAVKDGDLYSATAEVDMGFGDFKTYILMVIKYGPSAVEVSRPEELVLPANEFLSAVGEVIRVAKTLFERYHAGYKLQEAKGDIQVGLSEEEIVGLLDQGALRAKIVMEARGRSEEQAVKDLVGAVKEDLFVNKVKTKAMEEGEGFSGLIGIEAFMYEPRILFNIGVALTPVLIEIMEPGEVTLRVVDIQDIGVDIAGVFFELSHRVEAAKRGDVY